MKKTRIRFLKFSDGKQNLQFHWPKMHIQYLGHITHMSVLQLASFNNIWLQGKRKQGKST